MHEENKNTINPDIGLNSSISNPRILYTKIEYHSFPTTLLYAMATCMTD